MKTKTKKSKSKLLGWLVGAAIVLGLGYLGFRALDANAATPEQYGLHEGDLIRATGDNDIFIVNQYGYKRLFLNPAIFNMYGHLGGWSNVKTVSPVARDAFVTSPYYRADGDTKVYKLAVTGEDTGTLSWVNLSQADFLATADVNQIFTINSTELNWYPKGSDVVVGNVSSTRLANDNPASTTLTVNAQSFTMLSLTAGQNLSSLSVKRLGFSGNDIYGDGVYLFVNGKRATDAQSFNGTDSVATFNGLSIKSGDNVKVVANFAGSNGSIAQVQVSGSGFSFTSNSFTFANVSSGVLTLSGSTFVTDLVVGQIGAQIGQFTGTASSSEDITVKHLEFNKQGNLSSPTLVVDGVTYNGSVVDSKVVFDLNYLIKKGTTKTFKVYANVSGSAGDLVKLTLNDKRDVVTVGSTFGFSGGISASLPLSLSNTLIVQGVGSLSVASRTTADQTGYFGQSLSDVGSYRFTADKSEGFSIYELTFDTASNSYNKNYWSGVSSVIVNGITQEIGNTTTVVDLSSNPIVVPVDSHVDVLLGLKLKNDNDNNVYIVNLKPKLVGYKATGLSSLKDNPSTVDVATKNSVSSTGTTFTLSPVSSSNAVLVNGTNRFEFKLTANSFGSRTAALASASFDVASGNIGFTSSLMKVEIKTGSTWQTVDTLTQANGNKIVNLASASQDIIAELGDGDSANVRVSFDVTGVVDGSYLRLTLNNSPSFLKWTDDFNGDHAIVETNTLTDDMVFMLSK